MGKENKNVFTGQLNDPAKYLTCNACSNRAERVRSFRVVKENYW